MAWTNLVFAFGSSLSSTQMTQLHANFTAVCNGASGAPAFTNNAFPNQLFGDTKLSVSSSITSTSIPATSRYTFTGNYYYTRGFTAPTGYVELYINGSWVRSNGLPWTVGNSLSRFYNQFGSSRTMYLRYL